MNEQNTQAKALLSAKKAQGTLSKVIEMINDDRYCPDIIQQIDAVIGLLKSSKKQMLENHLDHCLATKMQENKKQAIEELLKIYNLGGK
jgi:DNA-binding FrmR family transcriptional regulator